MKLLDASTKDIKLIGPEDIASAVSRSRFTDYSLLDTHDVYIYIYIYTFFFI